MIIRATVTVLAAITATQVQEVEDLVDWAREHSHHVSTDAWRTADLGELAILTDELEGKRIVCIGEPDHYVHETVEMELLLIRALYGRGWTQLCLEVGAADGRRLDRYLETGDEGLFDEMGILGCRKWESTERDDEPVGFGRTRNSAAAAAAHAERRRFYRGLRWISETRAPDAPRLRAFGMDFDLRPGVGYADALDSLSSEAGEAMELAAPRSRARS
jgi:erythromycin esterase-like protein